MMVTAEPRRAKAWPSSQPMLPPPSTSSRFGNVFRLQTLSLVSGSASAKTGNRRQHRRRSGRHDRLPKRHCFVVDDGSYLADESNFSVRHSDSVRAQGCRRVNRLDGGYRPTNMIHHPREVELHVTDVDAITPCGPGIGRSMRRTQQRLAGNASGPQAVATGDVRFQQEGLSRRTRSRSSRQPVPRCPRR